MHDVQIVKPFIFGVDINNIKKASSRVILCVVLVWFECGLLSKAFVPKFHYRDGWSLFQFILHSFYIMIWDTI